MSLLARRLSAFGDFVPDEAGPPQTNLVQWLRADDLTGLADGDPVTTWPDRQGNFDMTAAGTQRPLLKTGVVNSRRAVLFDDSDDRLAGGPTFGNSTPFSLFYVANYLGSGGNQRAIQGTANYLLGPYTNASNAWSWYSGAFVHLGTRNGTAFVIHYLVFTGTAGTVRLRQGGATLSGSRNTTNGPGTLGLGAQGAFAEPMGGHIAEVLVYDTDLDATTREEVVDYLKDRYAIA